MDRSFALAIADQVILSYFGGPVSSAERGRIADGLLAAGGLPTPALAQGWFREASMRGLLPADVREMVGALFENCFGRPALDFEKDAWKAVIDQGFLTKEEAPWRIFAAYLTAPDLPQETAAGQSRLHMLNLFQEMVAENPAAQTLLAGFGPLFGAAKAWLAPVRDIPTAVEAFLRLDEVLGDALGGQPPQPPQRLHFGMLVDPEFVQPGQVIPRFDPTAPKESMPLISQIFVEFRETANYTLVDSFALDKVVSAPPGNGYITVGPNFTPNLQNAYPAERIRVVGSDGDNFIRTTGAIVQTGGGYDVILPHIMMSPDYETGIRVTFKVDRNTVDWASTDLGYLGKFNGVVIVTDFDPRFDVIYLGGGWNPDTQKRAVVSQHGPNTLIDVRPGPFYERMNFDAGYVLLLNTNAMEAVSRIYYGTEPVDGTVSSKFEVVLPLGLDNPYVTLLT